MRQKKKREEVREKKSHTQTHPRKPILTKKNHLLALRLHAQPKLKLNTTPLHLDLIRTAKHKQTNTPPPPVHSPGHAAEVDGGKKKRCRY